MVFRASALFGFLALFIPFVTAGHWGRRHQEVAHRARGDVDIHRRQIYLNIRFTFYDDSVAAGACGQWNGPNDFIVALSTINFGSGYPGPNCFRSITIQIGTKTTEATIMDECMGCPENGLDFSKYLFTYFADLSQGVIYGNWWYNDGGNGGQTSSSWAPATSTWNPPTTTSTPDYTPPPTTSNTPDYTPPPTTSNTPDYTPPPSTSSTSSTSTYTTTSTTTTSISSSSFSLSSGLAVPTAVVPSPGTNNHNPQNILVINGILVDIGIALCAAEETWWMEYVVDPI